MTYYRGTDKISEAPRVSYEKMLEEVIDKIGTHCVGEYILFVATDEQPFLDFMISIFGDNVCCMAETIRSTDGTPVHTNNSSPYKCGRDALIDALLLSHCEVLVRTSSNLSRWSTYFNPNLIVYEVSKRYGQH